MLWSHQGYLFWSLTFTESPEHRWSGGLGPRARSDTRNSLMHVLCHSSVCENWKKSMADMDLRTSFIYYADNCVLNYLHHQIQIDLVWSCCCSLEEEKTSYSAKSITLPGERAHKGAEPSGLTPVCQIPKPFINTSNFMASCDIFIHCGM